MPENRNSFLTETDKPLVALQGQRGGYLMIAPSKETLQYKDMPSQIFDAARNWAARLEALGAPRVYWMTLSEVTQHLHIHIYPRWPEDTLKGIPLFEAREDTNQPAWTQALQETLQEWATEFNVEMLSNDTSS